MKASRGVGSIVYLAMLVIAVRAVPAFASYTSVNGPASGEKSHAQIMGEAYGDGSSFTGSGTNFGNGLWSQFTNGTVTGYRIDDYDSGGEGLGTTTDILTGGVGDIDQFWSDGVAKITARAREASLNHAFGWNQGEGLDFTKIIAWNEDPVSFTVNSGHFLWADQVSDNSNPPNVLNVWWSDEAANWSDDLMDHMVTYKVEGLTDPEYLNKTVWLLYWEDLSSTSWDQDYNDFVIEISATIPEPTTIILLGFGGLFLLNRKRS